MIKLTRRPLSAPPEFWFTTIFGKVETTNPDTGTRECIGVLTLKGRNWLAETDAETPDERQLVGVFGNRQKAEYALWNRAFAE